jgi:ribosomal protein S18 acetylase RimI-like enzyme
MIVQEIRNSISAEEVEPLTPIFTEAFEKAPSDTFLERLNEKSDLSVLLAKDGDSIVGFKIGYTRFQGIFFSWLGAVAKSHYRQGIARALLQEQHKLCKERGYQEIQTEAAGSNQSMLILNLQESFEVYGVHMGHQGLTVNLRKFL